MSSWNNGKQNFRERRKPISPILQEYNQPSPSPSKYVFNTNIVDAVICAIALNEDRYIDEWIKYHLALGFSHIYIYDNSVTNTLKNKLSDNVTIIHFPGSVKQLEAYNNFVLNYNKKHTWCAFIDIDEFIVLKSHTTIIDFLNNYNEYGCVALNWLMFGTSNQKEYKNEPVTKRFIYCSNIVNKHIKCIAKLKTIDNYSSPHRPILKNGMHIIGCNKEEIVDVFNENGNVNIACIHHYYSKSEKEFREKIERGRADILQKRSTDELNDIHLRNNDILNTDAWNFYSKHCELS